MGKIAVIGSANVDMTVTVEEFPKPGETIFGQHFERFPGGKGANQAVGCAKLGANTVFFGKMGADSFKDYLFAHMSDCGVDLGQVIISKSNSTGVALISVDRGGQNQIIVVSGSNMELTATEVKNHSDVFDNADVILTQLEIPMETVEKVVELAGEKNVILILNPAPARQLPDKIFQNVDYLTPNEIELAILSDAPVNTLEELRAAARSLIKRGIKNIIVTTGEKGAHWISESEERVFQTRKVTAKDTTAAGDAFNGALAVALSRGNTIPEAIEYANLVASIAVTRMGAQTSMPTSREVDDLIQSLKVK